MNARAMVRTSVEMFKEGLITKERALLRVEPAMLEQLLVPQLSPNFHGKSLAQGLPASPGAASGKIVFDADTAEARGTRRREDHSGARGNQAGGHPRLLPGAGHPHQPRRQDLARRGGGARHGQALRFGLRADRDQRQGAQRASSAKPPCTKATSSPSTAAPAMSTPARCRPWRPSFRRKWPRCWPGRTRWRGCKVMANADTPEDAVTRARIRRHGHRPVPHRAHVQQHRPPAHRAGNDPGRDAGSSARRRWTGCCRSSARTSRASSRP